MLFSNHCSTHMVRIKYVYAHNYQLNQYVQNLHGKHEVRYATPYNHTSKLNTNNDNWETKSMASGKKRWKWTARRKTGNRENRKTEHCEVSNSTREVNSTWKSWKLNTTAWRPRRRHRSRSKRRKAFWKSDHKDRKLMANKAETTKMKKENWSGKPKAPDNRNGVLPRPTGPKTKNRRNEEEIKKLDNEERIENWKNVTIETPNFLKTGSDRLEPLNDDRVVDNVLGEETGGYQKQFQWW